MSYLYTIALVFFFPLFVYSSGLPGLSLGDVGVLITFSLLIFNTFFSGNYNFRCLFLPLFPFIGYILFQNFIFQCDFDVTLRCLRFVCYLLFVVLFAKEYFIKDLAIKLWERICFFATVFLIIQFFTFHIFHYYIPGNLPFLPMMNENAFADYARAMNDSSYYGVKRMASFFSEPAHYGSYVSMFLAASYLSNERKIPKSMPFFSLGILISTATTGIFLCSIIWFVIIANTFKKNFKIYSLIIFLLVVVTFVICIPHLSFFQNFILRINQGSSFAGRFDGYQIVCEQIQYVINFLFGYGMIERSMFLAGWARLFYFFGLIGSLLYFIPLVVSSYGSKSKMCFLFLFFLNGIGSSILLSGESMLVLAVLFTIKKRNNIND